MWFQCSLSFGIPVSWERVVWSSLGQVTFQHATPSVYNWYGGVAWAKLISFVLQSQIHKNYNVAHMYSGHLPIDLYLGRGSLLLVGPLFHFRQCHNGLVPSRNRVCTEWCWSTHTFEEQNWYALESSKLQVKAEFTETCPLGAPSSCHFKLTWMLLCLTLCAWVCMGCYSCSSGVPVYSAIVSVSPVAFQCGTVSTKFFRVVFQCTLQYSLGRPVIYQCTLG